MAPKRGGGSGGGGGGSEGTSLDDTPWGYKVGLVGSCFRDPYAVARVVFQGIGVVGIIAIMIWASKLKKPFEPNKKLFRCFAFWLTASALFVVFAVHTSVDIIYELQSVVAQVFFLIITILFQSGYIADISLLWVLYLLLPHCSRYLDGQDNRPQLRKGLRTGHTIFIFILFALWLPAMALKIKYQVNFVLGDAFDDADTSTIPSYQKLDTAFAILYFFGTLEIIGRSVLGFIDAKKQQESGQLELLLLALIAGPLLLRSAYLMGDAIFEELQQHGGTKGLWLATDIIYNLTSLAIYGGIVAICHRIARALQPPPDPNHTNPSYDPNFWGANGNHIHHHDPKNPMAVHEAAPPTYQQHVGHPASNPGGVQYAPPPQHQPHPIQQQYQQPYQQPYRGPGSSPHQQQQQQQPPYHSPTGSLVHHQQPQHTHTMISSGPSEMNGSSVSELSSPGYQHAR